MTKTDNSKTIPDEIGTIAELLRTQNNRATEAPIFVVYEKVRDYGYDPDYADDVVWIDTDRGEADEKMSRALDNCEALDRVPQNWRKVGYRDRWEFVTACLTEKGCEDFIMHNKHNLGETRIYAESSYRNHECQSIRKFLMGIRDAEVSYQYGKER